MPGAECDGLIDPDVIADDRRLADDTPVPWSMKKPEPMLAPG
jgi:hypothetical protein